MYLFIYTVGLLWLYELYIVQKLDVVDIPYGQFLALTSFFAYSGFVRSIGLMNAAHICYPLLIEALLSIFQQKKYIRGLKAFFK